MRLDACGDLHLTYCTNIHAGDGWDAVETNIRRFAPALKERSGHSGPFGLGLRLSARDARELLLDDRLDRFHGYLEEQGLYVALLNGFPYGTFHGTHVKADVYAPDWRDEARVEYTLNLVRILSRLLPPGIDGGISTSPLTYKAWMAAAAPDAMQVMTRNITLVSAALIETFQTTGSFIHLDIEPEPDCLVETTGETLAFFEDWLLPIGGPLLVSALGLAPDEADRALLDHVQVCFDCCHFAVEFEDPHASIDRLRSAGIGIGRVQLSSAIDVTLPATPAAAEAMAGRLRHFADSTYLHQVVQRCGATLRHFDDLDAALRDPLAAAGCDWRIHFHVPLFTDAYDGLGSTQAYVETVIDRAARAPFTRHLEIETYTWDVLPGDLKIDLLDSIHREYEWVLGAYRAAMGRV